LVSSKPKPFELAKLLATRPRVALAIMKFVVKGAAPLTRAFRRGNLEEGIRQFGDAVFGPRGYERLLPLRKKQVLDNASNVKAELAGSGFLPMKADQVRSLQIPALLVTGEHSIKLFHLLSDELAKLLTASERVEIPGSSLLIHEDNPEAYNKAVLRFIEKHERPSTTEPRLSAYESLPRVVSK
jgi:pimeloyl-ACP methyl ester carboxylesterase